MDVRHFADFVLLQDFELRRTASIDLVVLGRAARRARRRRADDERLARGGGAADAAPATPTAGRRRGATAAIPRSIFRASRLGPRFCSPGLGRSPHRDVAADRARFRVAGASARAAGQFVAQVGRIGMRGRLFADVAASSACAVDQLAPQSRGFDRGHSVSGRELRRAVATAHCRDCSSSALQPLDLRLQLAVVLDLQFQALAGLHLVGLRVHQFFVGFGQLGLGRFELFFERRGVATAFALGLGAFRQSFSCSIRLRRASASWRRQSASSATALVALGHCLLEQSDSDW